MWRNYLKTTIRNIIKFKAVSLINIFGLSIGIAASLIIFAYVNNELSYDRFHEKKDQIYRLNTEIHFGQSSARLGTVPNPLGPISSEKIPEIVDFTKIKRIKEFKIDREGELLDQKNLFYADASVFNIFSFDLLIGDPATALSEPNTIVLMEKSAKRLFGNTNPIGKILSIVNEGEFRITGVMKDLPLTTQIYAEYLASFKTRETPGSEQAQAINTWQNLQDSYTYLLVAENTIIDTVESRINGVIKETAPPPFCNIMEINAMNLKDLYMKAQSADLEPNGNSKYIYLFLSISFLLIIIASINFMNLSTAKYTHRVNEVGLRKVMGARRVQLIRQFIGESILITLISLIFGLLLVEYLESPLSQFIGKEFDIQYLGNFTVIGFILGIIVLLGILAGSYPAFFLSKFSPNDVFKADSGTGNRGNLFRKILVIVQFIIAIFLIISTAFIYRQLSFVKNSALGFNRENVVVLDLNDPNLQQKAATFRDELLRCEGIISATKASSLPASGMNMIRAIDPSGDHSSDAGYLQAISCDCNYAEAMGIELVEGRFFSEEFPSDKEKIVINETAVKEFNLENPVGRTFTFSPEENYEIIGVVKDFHSASMKNKIMSTYMRFEDSPYSGTIGVKIQEGKEKIALAAIEKQWNSMFIDIPFEYNYIEDVYLEEYTEELKMGKLFIAFTSIIVLIACLGIFGLASFTVEKRMKEIGIRKVMGANSKELSILLSHEFVIGVILANIIAWPLAYYSADKWLQGFAYKTNLSFTVFILGGLIAFLVALITVNLQTFKAAKTNPAEIIRYE